MLYAVSVDSALKKAENESLKDKLSLVIHQFLTHRQIGESEAYFKILPHLHMKSSNIDTTSIPTGFKQNRCGFLKELTKEEAMKTKSVIFLAATEMLIMSETSDMMRHVLDR